MEIVLLWLDDLDDLVFCTARLWEPVRHLCLQIGLGAALALGGAELAARGEWVDVLAAVAAGSVAVWFGGAACILAVRLKLRPTVA